MAHLDLLSAASDAFGPMSYRWKLPVAAVCSYFIYFIYSKITTRRIYLKFEREHGCQSPTQVPQFERILGLGTILKIYRQIKTKTHLETFDDLHKTLGPTFTITVLGQTFVMTRDPENVKALLATQFADFGLGMRLETLGPLLGKGIFVVDGAAWQHSRALIRPAFTKTQVADLDSFETHMQKLIAKVPKDGSTIDLAPLFFRLTLDVATDFLLEESVNSLGSEEGSKQHQFGPAFDYAQSRIGALGTYGWLRPFFYFSKFRRSCRFVHGFIDEFVARAQKEHRSELQDDKSATEGDEAKRHKRYVFLHELLKTTNDPIQIRDEVISILLAGRDTTASLLTTSFHVLSRRPDVWRKLQTEILELGGSPPDYETLRNMKYLKYFINETLRLYPVVPANSRTALKNTTIPRGGGPDGMSPIFIPKNREVSYSVWSMHRNTATYGADAEEFRPERWESLRTGWDYLPFNGG
ncbi:MAG: hypothetical protein M1835_002900, partial [Candelina submexicana]